MASRAGARRALQKLTGRGDTLAGLERLLHLSPGYLSKVKRGRVVPSPHLAALLEVLEKHPEVRETLESTAHETRSEARRRSGLANAPERFDEFVAALESAWTASHVRFQGVDDLLLASLNVDVPVGLEASVRFLVHPDDRHALSEVRALGASAAMAGSRASVCKLAGTERSVVIVFPLEPFHHLFRKTQLSATDAALYFALQGGEEAECRLKAIAKSHRLGRAALLKSFQRFYGDVPPLPQREWLLRATFDPEGARRRLSGLR